MAVRIKIATTAAEKDALFRLRHRVFVEQGKYMPARPDERIYDRFDAFPTTTNLIMIATGEVIGGVRLAEPSAVGTPADEYFDYSPYLPSNAARVGSASMLCMELSYRHRKRLISCLAGMFYYVVTRRGISHILAPCNPEIEDIMLATGYCRVADNFRHPSGLAVMPLVLDVHNVQDRFLRFIRAHQQQYLLHSMERAFFAADEIVLRQGQPSDAAYLIVDGEAVIETRSASGKRQSERLGPGSLLGELALITDRPHHADVVAASELDVLVLSRASFRRQLTVAPERALALLEAVSGRLLDLFHERLAEHPDEHPDEQFDGYRGGHYDGSLGEHLGI